MPGFIDSRRLIGPEICCCSATGSGRGPTRLIELRRARSKELRQFVEAELPEDATDTVSCGGPA